MNYSEEQLKDIQERREAFLQKYKELIDEYKVDFLAYPVFIPNDRGTFEITLRQELADTKYSPVKSPFVA